LQRLLWEQPDQHELLISEIEHEAADSPLIYYLRVLDADGAVYHQTPRMDDLLPVDRFGPPAQSLPDPAHCLHRYVRAVDSLRLLAVQAPLGPNGDEIWTVQAALDITPDLVLLAAYRLQLLGVLAGGILLATIMGGWLARRSIRPLTQIIHSARQMNASQLHERILSDRWPAELEEMALAFNAMLERLERSFARLSQFAGDLAHELRTPINNLRGEAEVALSRHRSPEEYQQILESSLEEYDRLTRTIDGLLFLARAEHPDTALDRVWFEARAEVDAVRDFYEAMAAEQGVRVNCEGAARVVGDALLFRTAVSNLLANALRHTPRDGEIGLLLRQTEQGGAELRVRDTGLGIPPEHLPRVFDRFYRVDGVRSQAPGNVGLGLAVVQSILRLHGGSARVESVEGKGTTVILDWPPPSGPLTSAVPQTPRNPAGA